MPAQHGHYEVPPYSDDDMRSTYHLREMDVLRLLQLEKPLDVFMSHDWPQHIARHGDTQALFRKKPFLQSEVQDGSLGSPPAMQLLQHLKPSYWFAAHLHVKFAAAFPHEGESAQLHPGHRPGQAATPRHSPAPSREVSH